MKISKQNIVDYIFLKRNFNNSIELKEDLINKIDKLTRQDNIKREVAGKFNGDIIMKLTPLSGAKLGSFIGYMTNAISSDKQEFNEWVLINSTQSIQETILSYYDKWLANSGKK